MKMAHVYSDSERAAGETVVFLLERGYRAKKTRLPTGKWEVSGYFPPLDRIITVTFFDAVTAKNRTEVGWIKRVRADGLVEVEVNKPFRRTVVVPAAECTSCSNPLGVAASAGVQAAKCKGVGEKRPRLTR